MTFFIDNNLSKYLSDGMKGFGEHVEHLTERFPPSAEDPEWLKYVGEKGLVLVTRDERLRWRPAEIRAFVQYGVRAFILGGKNRTRCQLIQQVVRNWPRMKELANTTPPPFAFRVPPTGAKITKLQLI
jgi:predicted nuclease of predicted toxin-antitoxin system